MKQLIDRIEHAVETAFETAGYHADLGKVTVSNRPDLCEYQCNGALSGAKQYHKAPFLIAQEVAEALGSGETRFSESFPVPGMPAGVS